MTGPGVHVALAAQEAAPAQGLDGSFFLMMGVIFAIFYFLVLRPQQKKQRALEESVKGAAKGDRVITAGGLYGKVVAAEEDALTLEIASIKGQPVRVQVARARIESVTKKGDADAAAKEPAKDPAKGDDK
jgi:preprotein translocase subunit YajC